ncbi:uncharacterized protein LOC130630418 [Hydractinia symbiolongicarpus]|uniref:uncharacterized protein LOC130630418 n=1 Tax=Hydractinia symbiolongicarpus TaxID=13093 RepID=UPI00254F79CF|nr:uncharacterized protein LOC130630418 [Hydractinia symbiolongicarpus]
MKYRLQATNLIQNVKNTSGCTHSSGVSWIQFYKYRMNTINNVMCVVKDCCKVGEVGAHVAIDVHTAEMFIVPMCKTHNHPTVKDWMEVKEGRLAVSITREDANNQQECYYSN